MNQNRLLFSQIQTLPPTKHGKWKEIFYFYRNQPVEIVGYWLPMKSPIELKGKSV